MHSEVKTSVLKHSQFPPEVVDGNVELVDLKRGWRNEYEKNVISETYPVLCYLTKNLVLFFGELILFIKPFTG